MYALGYKRSDKHRDELSLGSNASDANFETFSENAITRYTESNYASLNIGEENLADSLADKVRMAATAKADSE